MAAMDTVPVYFEIGSKRVFAGALDWPGWCRSGTDEDLALKALLDYGPRYAGVMVAGGLEFTPPGALANLTIVERLAGGSTTDFGAPETAPAADAEPVDEDELDFFKACLDACWQALDLAAQRARGKTLRLGPRGGGRDLEKILAHVRDAQLAYLGRLGWKFPKGERADLPAVRRAMPQGLSAAARGELSERGPRGGARWTPRYFVRRSAWHILDHAWEIEDRLT
jgi:hypothetical protein